MSDNVPPLDLQVEIMERLPVKSLLQFRSVSKAWKSLIDSPPFIARYSGQQQHLLVSYMDELGYCKYDSIVDDDDTFPHQRFSITLPECVAMLLYRTIIGSSHGLFCLHNYLSTETVIWNPSIRKAVSVYLPKAAAAVVVPNAEYETLVGFGVCGETSDPKIVNIAYHTRKSDMFSISGVPWQVEVFRLSTGSWRSTYNTNLSRKSIRLSKYDMVVIDGVHYWLAEERIATDGDESRIRMLIVSFDVTTEEFSEVSLPDSVAYRPDLSLYELRGSPVVLQEDVEADDSVFYVWMMEEGVTKSFTKLFTFNRNTLDSLSYVVKGFRKTGEFILEIFPDVTNPCETLAVYDPYSKSLDCIGVREQGIPHYVYSYVESLLLL